MKTIDIYLYHKLPTPYNDNLFRVLYEREEVNLHVYHLWKKRDNRPWTVELATGYENHYLNTKWFGVDWGFTSKAVREKKAFFMIGDWAYPSSIIVLILRVLLGYPVGIWADTPQEHLPRPWYKKYPRKLFLSWLLSHVDIAFGTGMPGTRTLAQMGARKENIVNLPCFVDLGLPAVSYGDRQCVEKRALYRNEVACEEEDVVFLISGMLTFKKAQEIGIKAFAKCYKRNKNIGLLIAGSGPDKEVLTKLIESLGLSSKISILGWLDPIDMNAAYMAADVLVHCARWDPFPLVIMEAMSWGKVVLGSDVCGSVEDRIVHGENGFSFRSENIDELSSLMALVATDSELRGQISKEARKTAEKWPVERGVEIIIEAAKKSLK